MREHQSRRRPKVLPLDRGEICHQTVNMTTFKLMSCILVYCVSRNHAILPPFSFEAAEAVASATATQSPLQETSQGHTGAPSSSNSPTTLQVPTFFSSLSSSLDTVVDSTKPPTTLTQIVLGTRDASSSKVGLPESSQHNDPEINMSSDAAIETGSDSMADMLHVVLDDQKASDKQSTQSQAIMEKLMTGRMLIREKEEKHQDTTNSSEVSESSLRNSTQPLNLVMNFFSTQEAQGEEPGQKSPSMGGLTGVYPEINTCHHNGAVYESGQMVATNHPCDRCTCREGKVFCYWQQCDGSPDYGCVPLFVPGSCCPVYSCEGGSNGGQSTNEA